MRRITTFRYLQMIWLRNREELTTTAEERGNRTPLLSLLGWSTRCSTSIPTRLWMALTVTRAVNLLLFKRWYLLLPTLTRICVHVLWDRSCEAKHPFYRIRLIACAMFQRCRIPNTSVISSVPQKQYSYRRYFTSSCLYCASVTIKTH